MTVLKVNDQVILSETSKYYSYKDSPSNPKNTVGIIIKVNTMCSDKYAEFSQVKVEWSNGTYNTYYSPDLILVTDNMVINPSDRWHHVIVAAANKVEIWKDGEFVKDLVVVDNCHFGKNMREIFKTFIGLGCEVKHSKVCKDRGQGFIDCHGNFYNRSGAYQIAKKSGQLFNDEFTLGGDRLDSSCIRHFELSRELRSY